VINNIDFSDHVIAGSYEVGNVPVLTEWTDANNRLHREVYRERLQGSFDMYFRTVDDFEEFNQAYKTVRQNSGLTRVSIMNNSTNQVEQKDVYFEFSPVRNRHDNWEDYYEQFTVNVKEW
jgi:hypothetical protein